jgi:hypothetical protein
MNMETQKLSVELGEMLFTLSSEVRSINFLLREEVITPLEAAGNIYFLLRQETAFKMTPETVNALNEKNLNFSEFKFTIDVEDFFFFIVILYDKEKNKFLITID